MLSRHLIFICFPTTLASERSHALSKEPSPGWQPHPTSRAAAALPLEPTRLASNPHRLALTLQRLLTKLMALCASASASRTGKNSPSLLGPCDQELTEPDNGARSAAASTPSVGSSTADWVLYKVCVWGGHPAFQLDETHYHTASVNIICSAQVAPGKGLGLRDWAPHTEIARTPTSFRTALTAWSVTI